MSRASFKQADVERLLKAAKNQGFGCVFDLRTHEAKFIPVDDSIKMAPLSLQGIFPPDGKDAFDED